METLDLYSKIMIIIWGITFLISILSFAVGINKSFKKYKSKDNLKKISGRFKKSSKRFKKFSMKSILEVPSPDYSRVTLFIFPMIAIYIIIFLFCSLLKVPLLIIIIIASILNLIASYFSYYIGTFSYADSMPIWVKNYYKYVEPIGLLLSLFCMLAELFRGCSVF